MVVVPRHGERTSVAGEDGNSHAVDLSEGAPLFRPKKKVRESTQKVEIQSPCIEWVTMVVYMCSEVPGS